MNNVPPGYKQTEVGVIPEEWDVQPLGALVGYTNGKAHEQSINDSGRFVVVNSKFISTEGFTRKYSEHSFCPASKGDVLMVMSDVPNGRAIAKCYWVESDNTYTVNQRICILNPRGIDGKLLLYKLDRNPFYLAFDDGAKQTNLRKDEVLACPLGIPKSEAEQRAIATALSDVDGLLGALDRLIAKKRDLKQAAMQQLLTGQTRLPGFHGEWEVKRLGEMCEIAMGRTPPRLSPAFWGRGYKWLSIADLQSKVVAQSKEEITELAASGMNIIPKGTLLMSFKLSIGRLCFAGCDLFTNEAICSFNKLQADAEFLYYALSRTDFSLYGKQAVKGYTLNKESLKLVEVRLPSTTSEQTAIAAVLSDMDAELALLEQRLAKTRALKQGMMQELLTGRVRLIN